MLQDQYKYNPLVFLIILVMLSSDSNAQIVKTDSVYETYKFGFSQAIVLNGWVYTSGQVGWDKDYQLTGNGDFKEQAEQCFKNLELILSEAGSSLSNSIHLRIFITDISDKNKTIVTTLIKKYFPNTYQPASTLLCVKALARKELMIEIEAVSLLNNSLK